jgi:hypothetical protein
MQNETPSCISPFCITIMKNLKLSNYIKKKGFFCLMAVYVQGLGAVFGDGRVPKLRTEGTVYKYVYLFWLLPSYEATNHEGFNHECSILITLSILITTQSPHLSPHSWIKFPLFYYLTIGIKSICEALETLKPYPNHTKSPHTQINSRLRISLRDRVLAYRALGSSLAPHTDTHRHTYTHSTQNGSKTYK